MINFYSFCERKIMMFIQWFVGFLPYTLGSLVLGLQFLHLHWFCWGFRDGFGPPCALRVTPSVSRFLIVIETCYFESFISFHLECSQLTFLCRLCRACSWWMQTHYPAQSINDAWFGPTSVVWEIWSATTCYDDLLKSIMASYSSGYGYVLVYFCGSWFKTSGIVQPYTTPVFFFLFSSGMVV